jgi:hypothetical protein
MNKQSIIAISVGVVVLIVIIVIIAVASKGSTPKSYGDVLVVGGGISGIAAYNEIFKLTGVHPRLVFPEPHAGGRIASRYLRVGD